MVGREDSQQKKNGREKKKTISVVKNANGVLSFICYVKKYSWFTDFIKNVSFDLNKSK